MTILQWNDSLNIGMPEVDQQHQHLVEMVNELDEAFTQGTERAELKRLYDGLGEYTREHFGTEERLMAEGACDPDHVRRHKSMHADFIRTLGEMKSSLDDPDPKVVGGLLDYLFKWLVHHTQGQDREMARLLDGSALHHSHDHETLQRALDREKALLNLVGALRESEKRFRALTESLEQRIAQRTAELSESNRQLVEERESQHALIMKLAEVHNQLLQSEKLASIGQLAAGVAHEINNPIGFVNSNLGTLARYVEDLLRLVDVGEQGDAAAFARVRDEIDLPFVRDDAISLLAESRDGVARVKRIVQDLKDFSHVDEAEWQLADLHKGLDSTLNVVSNEIKDKVDVVKEYGEIPCVECLTLQINQVFMNMLLNAAHAMNEGTRGLITVRTGAKGDEVWVEFVDNGKGIPPENMTRIFDPFFTTKPIGKGTGLGLSLSYGIIENHHGHIEVESEVGKGTTFRVWLPVKNVALEAG